MLFIPQHHIGLKRKILDQFIYINVIKFLLIQSYCSCFTAVFTNN